MPGSAFQVAPVAAPADQSSRAPPVGQAPSISAEEMKRRTAHSREISAGLGQLVSLLMRSRAHKFSMLADLEWMVAPALASRQFCVAEGVLQENGMVMPVAAVMWASVSDEVDKRLSETLDLPVKLKPEEWRSGTTVWIVDVIGDPKAVNAMLQHLKQNELKDKTVRMRVRGRDGKAATGRLELQQETETAAAPAAT